MFQLLYLLNVNINIKCCLKSFPWALSQARHRISFLVLRSLVQIFSYIFFVNRFFVNKEPKYLDFSLFHKNYYLSWYAHLPTCPMISYSQVFRISHVYCLANTLTTIQWLLPDRLQSLQHFVFIPTCRTADLQNEIQYLNFILSRYTVYPKIHIFNSQPPDMPRIRYLRVRKI